MPIPAAAGVIAAVVHFFSGTPVPNYRVAIMWMILVMLTGLLMVSTWRFWSGKEINLADRHPFQRIVLLGLGIYAIVFFSQVVLALIAFFYMFSGIFARAAYSWQRRHKAAHRQLPAAEGGVLSEASSASSNVAPVAPRIGPPGHP
jgi:CDP-diacylglycerol---serine O-phosphatidyltransferase